MAISQYIAFGLTNNQGENMKKKLLLLGLLAGSLFGSVASDVLVVELRNASIDFEFKCEKKESSWYEFDTEKDDALDEYCKDKTVGSVHLNYDSALPSGTGYSYVQNEREIQYSEIPEDYKISVLEILKEVTTWSTLEPAPHPPYELELVNKNPKVYCNLFIKTPINKRKYIFKSLKVSMENHTIDIPRDIELKKYTNTYSIDGQKECIDGKIWIKKYGKMSGDKCGWKPLVK
jgi:hypothetical protein